jgi:hypothetical protein
VGAQHQNKTGDVTYSASQIWYRNLPENFPLFLTTTVNYLSNFSITMSTDWSVLFDETLAEYVQQYIEACGDTAARAQVLKDCQEDITKSPLHEEQDIELPEHLCWVSILFH